MGNPSDNETASPAAVNPAAADPAAADQIETSSTDAEPTTPAQERAPSANLEPSVPLDVRHLSFAELEARVDSLDRARCSAMLQDGRAVVRANGLRALAVLRVASPGMVPLLRDSEESVALAAAHALARLGAGIEPLIPDLTRALDGVRPAVREEMLDTLASLVGTADDALITALDGPPEAVHGAAVEAPLRAGRPGALLLSRALLHEKTLVRYNSARGLTHLANAGLFSTMGVDRRIVETLVSVRHTDDAADVRAVAGEALSALVASEHRQAQIHARQAVAEAAAIAIDGFTERPISAEILADRMHSADKPRALAALRDGRTVVRCNAARALGALGAERAGDTVKAVSVLLRDSESAVRLAAAEAMDGLRPASLAVAERLVTSLGDRDRAVAEATYRVLQRLGPPAVEAVIAGFGNERRQRAHGYLFELVKAHPDAVELLSQAFLDPRVDVQIMVAKALGHLGADRIGAGRQVLEAARTGGDARTRAAVREALAGLAGPQRPGAAPGDPVVARAPGFADHELGDAELAGIDASAPELAAALGDGRPLVRANAARALGALGTPGAAYGRLLIVLLRDSDVRVGSAAARALSDLGTAVADATPSLAQSLDGVHRRVREQALAMLAGLVGRADDALVAALDVAPESLGQDAVVEALARSGSQGAQLLMRALFESRTLVRYNSAKGLQRLAQSGALAGVLPGTVDVEIVEALERVRDTDDAADVRAAADQALSALVAARADVAAEHRARAAAEAARLPVAEMAEKPLDRAALRAHLSGLPVAELVPRLALALRDGRPLVRANSARALAVLGPDAAGSSVRPISVLLRDTEPSVRLAAAQALDGLRPQSSDVAPALVTALGDRDESVGKAAYRALAGLEQSAVQVLLAGLASERRERGRERLLSLIHARPDAVELLSRAFLDPRVDVQVSAALGLGRLGAERIGAGRRVLEAARTGGDARTRAAVRDALAMLTDRSAPGPAPADQLEQRFPGFTTQILPLEGIGTSPSDAELVARALGDGRAVARANAAVALGGLGAAAMAHARLLIVLLRDSDPRVGLAAARALTGLGTACAPVIPAVAQALDGVHPRVREQVLEMLVGLVGKVDDALVSALDVPPESFGQDAVVEALVSAGRPGAMVLARALTQEQTLVRYNSARGIQRVAKAGGLSALAVDTKIVDALESVRTTDEASDVRATAGVALAAIAAARQDEAAQYKAQAAKEAAAIAIPGFDKRVLADDEVVAHRPKSFADRERVALALQDSRPVVRENAARLLSAAPDELSADWLDATVRVVAVLLRDSEVDVRQAATGALVTLSGANSAAIVPVADGLVDALADVDTRVCEGAGRALRALGNSAIGALTRGLESAHQPQVARVIACIHALETAEEVLCQAFASPSSAVRANAAAGLAGLGRERVTTGLQVLAAARTGGDAATRAAVRAALVALAPPKPAGPPAIAVPGFHERLLDPLAAGATASAPVALDSLLAALGDPRPFTRANAATFLALGSAPVELVTSALSVLMRDGDPSVRTAAATALGQRGSDAAGAADALVRALTDGRVEVADAAREALTRLGHEVIPALARGLETDDSEHAGQILSLIAERADAEQILAGWFATGSDFVRVNAARGLGLLGERAGDDARHLLEAARTGASLQVRAAVSEALANLSAPADTGPPAIVLPGFHERALRPEELSPDALSSVSEASLVAALGDGSWVTRANGLTALGNLGAGAKPHLRLIAVMLRDAELAVASAAADALARLGAEVANIVSTIARARDDAHPVIGERVVGILRNLVGDADDQLIGALDASPELGQDAVVEALVRAGRPGALLLVRALLVERTLVRFNSARGIERLAGRDGLSDVGLDREILQALGTVRGTDDASDVRTAAGAAVSAVMAARTSAAAEAAQRRVRAAGAIAIPGFTTEELSIAALRSDSAAQISAGDIERLRLALSDGEPLVRANAARVLAAVGPERAGHAVRAISVLLRDSEAAVQRAAAVSLAAFGDAALSVADALVGALGSDDPEVHAPASAALKGLGGRAQAALLVGLEAASRAHVVRIIECIHELPDGRDVLTRAFSSPSVAVQVAAAQGLGMLGRERIGDSVALLLAARTGGALRTQAAVRSALEMLAPAAESGPPDVQIAGFYERALSADELSDESIGRVSVLAAMNDIRPFVRANAATALATGGDHAAHFLAILLRDGEPTVRVAAARALANPGVWAAPESGAGEGVLQALVGALGDADEAVAAGAERALLDRGTEAKDALSRGLTTSSRVHAERICRVIHRGNDPVETLVTALESPSVDVQINAALGLGMLGPEGIGRGLAALEQVRTRGDRRARAAVRQALTMVAPAVDEESPEIAIDGFHERILTADNLSAQGVAMASISSALRDGRIPTRANAATLLGRTGAAAQPHIHALSVLLRDSSTEVRRAAAMALAELGSVADSEADGLVAALGDRDTQVAAAASAALTALGNAARAALVRGLDSDAPRQVYGAIALIHKLDDPVEVLCDAFTSDSVDTQINAAVGLGRLGPERIGKGLEVLQVARTGGDRRTRAAVRDVLSMLAPPMSPSVPQVDIEGFYERVVTSVECQKSTRSDSMIEALMETLQDGRELVRTNGATALGALRTDAAVLPISVLLRDSSPTARAAAAAALGEMGDAAIDAADALAAALGDRVAAVIEAATATVRGLAAAAAPALIRALDTDDEAHADRLLRLLAPLPPAPELLFDAFQSPALNVKINAAHGLGMLGAERVSKACMEALDDEQWYGDLRKRIAVRRALRALSS